MNHFLAYSVIIVRIYGQTEIASRRAREIRHWEMQRTRYARISDRHVQLLFVDVRRLPGVLVAVEFEGPGRPWDSTWYRRPVLSRWYTRSSKKNRERSSSPDLPLFFSLFLFSATLRLSSDTGPLPFFHLFLLPAKSRNPPGFSSSRSFFSSSSSSSTGSSSSLSTSSSLHSDSPLRNGSLTFRPFGLPWHPMRFYCATSSIVAFNRDEFQTKGGTLNLANLVSASFVFIEARNLTSCG